MRDLVHDMVYLETERLDLPVKGRQDLSGLEVKDGIDLVDEARHPSFSDHLRSDLLGSKDRVSYSIQ